MAKMTLEGMEIEVDALKGAVVVLENGQLRIRRDLTSTGHDLSAVSERMDSLSTELRALAPRLDANTAVCVSIEGMLKDRAQRAAVAQWFAGKFTSMRSFALTVGAIAIAVGAVSGGFQWLLRHFLP